MGKEKYFIYRREAGFLYSSLFRKFSNLSELNKFIEENSLNPSTLQIFKGREIQMILSFSEKEETEEEESNEKTADGE